MKSSKSKTLMDLLIMEDDPMIIYGIRTETHLLYFLEDIEREIRQSREYRSWVFIKKYKHKQTICKAIGIDVADHEGIHIQQHHWPISLYDIVLIVGIKMISLLKKDEYLTTFDIASQVIKEHLSQDNLIGSVSLLTSYHEMYHSGIQILNKEDINGNYQKFIDKYKEYIPTAVKERIEYNLKEGNSKI